MAKEKRKPTLLEALVPIFGMLLLLGIGYGVYGLPNQVLLIASAAVAFIIAKRVGYTWEDIMDEFKNKLHSSAGSILVMISVGALIGSMMVSGTIPMLIYFGIRIINPQFLLVTAFLVCAVVSTFTGTSFGSAGTVGVAIMGVAIALGVNPAAAAGAVISGAVFGDKLSPFSDTTILAPVAAGCTLYEHIRHLLYTTGASSIVCIIVYVIAGLNTSISGDTSPEFVDQMLGNLTGMFNFNILLLLPVAFVLIGAFVKLPTVPVLLGSSLFSVFLGMIFQGFSLKTALNALVSGFNTSMVTAVDTETLLPEINTLLNRGGMTAMMSTVLLILCAFSYAAVVSKSGCMEVIMGAMIKGIRSVGSLVTAAVSSTILMSLVTGSSYIAILIPGEMFRDMYKKWGLHAKNLSRTLEDGGTCIVPLVPWAVAGTYMSTTLGVPTLSYLPWAVLCYTGFIFAIIYGFTGFGMAKLDPEEGSEATAQ